MNGEPDGDDLGALYLRTLLSLNVRGSLTALGAGVLVIGAVIVAIVAAPDVLARPLAGANVGFWALMFLATTGGVPLALWYVRNAEASEAAFLELADD